MIKPRIYFMRYQKLGRGYWRVSKMPNRSVRNIRLWNYAWGIVTEMNKAMK